MTPETLLDQPTIFLKNVGSSRAAALQKLGIFSVADLLFYFPREYDRRIITDDFRSLKKGDAVYFYGRIESVKTMWTRRHMCIIRVMMQCESGQGTMCEVSFFNQPYLKGKLTSGTWLRIYGRVSENFLLPQITAEEWQVITPDEIGAEEEQRIIPVYRVTEGITVKYLTKLIAGVLNLLTEAGKGSDICPMPEIYPQEILINNCFPDRWAAIREIHQPQDQTKLQQARQRFKYEESFAWQLIMRQKNKDLQSKPKQIICRTDGELHYRLLAGLGFELTASQKRTWQEISSDMERIWPMNRLLQGDVGSGKTIIAVMALIKAVENGMQGVLMAPTEILAEQHFYKLSKIKSMGIDIGLLTGKMQSGAKKEILEKIAAGDIKIVIGTHALLEQNVKFKQLGLVIIDEQHRFGVRQRAVLQYKGQQPDVLIMTATPIPRTLALTVYNDLNISVIDEMPAGRKPIKTYWLQEDYLPRVYSLVRKTVSAGHQVYMVCPLIEESEHVQARAAEELAHEMQNKVFPDLSVGLLHGRLASEEKEQVMKDFLEGKVSVLVSTTVIEVGVDVPNAVLMIIYGAERFGLSQLHQLRGRIGRGSGQSYCILLGNPETEQGRERLQTMCRTSDGFKIAEADLMIRGPGDFFGTRQAGVLSFKMLDLLHDQRLIEQSQKDADRFISVYPPDSQEFIRIMKACRELLGNNQQWLDIR